MYLVPIKDDMFGLYTEENPAGDDNDGDINDNDEANDNDDEDADDNNDEEATDNDDKEENEMKMKMKKRFLGR